MKKDTRVFLITVLSIPALLFSANVTHEAWLVAHPMVEAEPEEAPLAIETQEEESILPEKVVATPSSPVVPAQVPKPVAAPIVVQPSPTPDPAPAPVVTKPAPAPRTVVVKKSRKTRAS